ncbi:MAG: hypothetical protein ACRD3W_13915, partial [Terriglobales bacterium]
MLCMAVMQPASAAEQMLVLEQKHHLYGKLKVYLCERGAKVDYGNQGMVIFCQAPAWNAIFYKVARKQKFTVPYATWSRFGIKTVLSLENNLKWNGYPHLAQPAEKYAGISCVHVAFPDHSRAGYDFRRQAADYLYYDKFAGAKKSEAFLRAFYDVPAANGVPMRF